MSRTLDRVDLEYMVTSVAADPLRTLGAGLVQAAGRRSALASAVVADPSNIDAIVSLSANGYETKALAAAFRATAEAQGSLLDVFA